MVFAKCIEDESLSRQSFETRFFIWIQCLGFLKMGNLFFVLCLFAKKNIHPFI